MERNRTHEQCQSQQGIIWAGSFIFQPQVLKSQQGVKPAVQAVSHGNDAMCMFTCTFKRIVSHEPVIKPKSNHVFFQKEIPHLSVDEVTSCPYSDLTRACPPPPPLGSEADGGGRKPRRRRGSRGPMVVAVEEEGCSRRAAAGGHAASLRMHLQLSKKTALSFTPNSRSRDTYQRTYQLMGVAHGKS